MTTVLRFLSDHFFTKSHASEYLDGDLSEAGRQRVERHTSVCPRCRALLQSLRRVLEALPELASPRGGIADQVVDRLRREA